MNISSSLNTVDLLLNLAIQIKAQADVVSAQIEAAKADGRTTHTAEEWAVITDAEKQAHAALDAAIQAAWASA